MLYTYWRFQSDDRMATRALVVASALMGYFVTGASPCTPPLSPPLPSLPPPLLHPSAADKTPGYLIWYVQHFVSPLPSSPVYPTDVG